MRKLHIALCVLISAAFVALGVFVFSASFVRFWEAITDMGISVAVYFCEIFSIPYTFTATFLQPSSVFGWADYLPENYDGFKQDAATYFSLLVSKENFSAWGQSVGVFLGNAAKVLILILPVLVILFFVVRWLYMRGNRRHNVDTVPLRAFKWLAAHTYQPIKAYLHDFRAFLSAHNWIWKCWIALWVFHLNLASIGAAFLAFYFYFVVKFDFGCIYTQLGKLFVDLNVILRHFPWWSLATIAWLLFNHWRRKVALNRLRHFEARDCGFINELPIVSITCGSMGKKKTTAITDMALSQEVMFRQKALSILQNTDMKFPAFPWIKFEDELRACMQFHTVYNLATAKAWVEKKRERYAWHTNADFQLYGYDVVRYGFTYNDALKTIDLFDALSTYAQAYFIYVIESSLIVSNYSIRTDNALLDEGNFPLWLTDFFPKKFRDGERHAHILDFDVLRLGKKMIADNPNIGSFEFGVVTISEIGKERGNNLELQEKKKKDDETNQKNDLFNAWLKMCRHSATVDNFPFIKVFTDEQRPESWGADARDLCDIIRVAESGEQRLALPFYTIEEMLSEWVFNRFINLYYDFRYRRGDNTLLIHALKTITAALWRRNIRIYNRYGYCILRIEKERGTMDGKIDRKKYYLMNRKIYARRFSTDCFSDYFNDMARKSKVGLNDYLEYVTERASVDELKMQNSYFINALYKGVTP